MPDKWTRGRSGQSRPITRLGYQVGQGVLLRGPQFFKTISNIFKLCPTHFPRGPKIFLGGLRPSWLRAWGKVVTVRPPKRLAQVRSSLLFLQRQVAKLANRLLYSWSLLRCNTARNLQMFTSSYGSSCFAACDQGSHWGFFPPISVFFSRPVCLGLILKKLAWNLCFLKW